MSDLSISVGVGAVVVLVVVVAIGVVVGSATATATLRRGAAGQADVAVKREVISTQLTEMRGQMRADLERLERVVTGLGHRTSEQFGQVDGTLRLHAEATASLSNTANGLREALANPKARG